MVDTTQNPPRPKTDEILLEGPTVHIYDSDPPGQLIPVSFLLDPPLAFPSRGLYAFFLQPENCADGVPWVIIAREDNPYAPGQCWLTPRTFGECVLRQTYVNEPLVDLLFRAEYCVPDDTPTVPSSWGRVKVLYRSVMTLRQ